MSRARKERRKRAYHEGGHAVVARVLGVEVVDISMLSTDDSVAHVLTRSAAHTAVDDVNALAVGLELDLKVSLAGLAAQKAIGYPASDGDFDGDKETAHIAALMLARLQSGLPATPGSEPTVIMLTSADNPLIDAANEIIARATEQTETLVGQHFPAIVRVAGALQRQDHLTAAELDRLIGGKARA